MGGWLALGAHVVVGRVIPTLPSTRAHQSQIEGGEVSSCSIRGRHQMLVWISTTRVIQPRPEKVYREGINYEHKGPRTPPQFKAKPFPEARRVSPRPVYPSSDLFNH